jgi:hypothetical protein
MDKGAIILSEAIEMVKSFTEDDFRELLEFANTKNPIVNNSEHEFTSKEETNGAKIDVKHFYYNFTPISDLSDYLETLVWEKFSYSGEIYLPLDKVTTCIGDSPLKSAA